MNGEWNLDEWHTVTVGVNCVILPFAALAAPTLRYAMPITRALLLDHDGFQLTSSVPGVMGKSYMPSSNPGNPNSAHGIAITTAMRINVASGEGEDVTEKDVFISVAVGGA